MTTLNRVALPLINAFFITACLLYIMFSLINTGETQRLAKRVLPTLEWAQVPEDLEVDTGFEKPKQLEEPEEAPKIPEHKPLIVFKPSGETHWSDFELRSGDVQLRNPDDSQLVLALGFPPVYPNGALRREIEGYVVVGFSVGPSGQVFDAYVLESEPAGTFDRSALKAIKKFKYKARMVDGKGVSTDGQRYMFTFKIDQ